MAVGSGGGAVDDDFLLYHVSPHFLALPQLVFWVDVLTHYRIATYRADSHQLYPAVWALSRFLGFLAALRTDVLLIRHHTSLLGLLAINRPCE